MNIVEFRNEGALQGRRHLAEVAGIRENRSSLFIVLREITLSGRMRQAIQTRIHAGDDEEQAGDQKDGDFKKAFHNN